MISCPSFKSETSKGTVLQENPKYLSDLISDEFIRTLSLQGDYHQMNATLHVNAG